MVSRYPDHEAVRTIQGACTYKELDILSNQTANAVLYAGADRVEPVALISAGGISAVCAILGILKAGKFYVPLEPSLPTRRLQEHLNTVEAVLIVTDAEHEELTRRVAPPASRIINVDKRDHGSGDLKDVASISRDRNDLICVTYSSGSTGKPKGVMQTNYSVMQMAFSPAGPGRWRNIRVAQQASLAYTWSIFDIFGALLGGSTLCPFNTRTAGFDGLARWLGEFKIDYCGFAPTVFRAFCMTLRPEDKFPECRFLYLGGSAISVQDVELYRRHFSRDTLLITSLSSSEAGNITTYYIDHDLSLTEPVPVGYADPGCRISIVDSNRAEVAPGEIGEIAVTSTYLSPGYWRNDELTREKFSPAKTASEPRTYYSGDRGWMSKDGCLTYTGRIDNLVKVNAHMVDVGEVENALTAIDGIEQVAVVVDRSGRVAGDRLVAHVVVEPASSPSQRHLRVALAERLPFFMVPATFVFRDELPLTETNKIDYQKLSQQNP